MTESIDELLLENTTKPIAYFSSDGFLTRTNRAWELIWLDKPDADLILTYNDFVEKLGLPPMGDFKIQDSTSALYYRKTFRIIRKRLYLRKGYGLMVEMEDISSIRNNDSHNERFFADSMWKIRSRIASLQNVFSLVVDYNPDYRVADMMELFGESYREVWELGRQVETLRYLTLLDSGVTRLKVEPSVVNLKEAADAVLLDLEPLFKTFAHPPSVSVDIEDGATVQTDREILRRILSTLVYNALIYNDNADVGISIRCTRQSEEIRLSVHDNGCGIGENEQGSIFAYAFRGENARSSTHSGLGVELYIARKLSGFIRSELKFESKPGQGTRFDIIFGVWHNDT